MTNGNRKVTPRNGHGRGRRCASPRDALSGFARAAACLLAPAAITFVSACTTTAPATIRTPLPDSPQLADVRRAPQEYIDRTVRWGGTIAAIDNDVDQTTIQVLGRPLERDGRPRVTDETAGRFIARVGGFLDPVVFEAGREVTVVGTVTGTARRTIGEYPYEFPVVHAKAIHLWEPQPVYLYPPFWPHPWGWPGYDPFWYPYGYW